MKPILFNTEMVRAILEGRKTVTRRVVKPHPPESTLDVYFNRIIDGVARWGWRGSAALCNRKLPYRPGDILYVRETWTTLLGRYLYKANQKPGMKNPGRWHPSIHMPREAARIFLRVTDVKVQRVQDITDKEAEKEGVKGWMVATERDWDKNPNFVIAFRHVWNDCYAKPRPVKVKGVITHYESYPWEDINETRTYKGKPWYVIGNPWIWAVEFKRCEKPKGD